jgi:hypothetical protein
LENDNSVQSSSKLETHFRWVEPATHLGALLVAATYVAGFLVVTLRNSTYGIAEFSFLRAKIFAAGVSFLIMTVVPAMVMLRMISVIGGHERGTEEKGPAASLRHKLFILCLNLSSLYAAGFTFALGLSLLLGDLKVPTGPGTPLLLVWFLFNLIVAVAVALKLERQPIPSLALCILMGVALALIASQSFDLTFILRTVWFFVVGILSLYFSSVLRNPRWRTSMEWEKQIIPLIFLVLFYAKAIYGNISPTLGGGRPTRAVLFSASRTSVLKSDNERVLLLEETDAGYYFEKQEGDTSVYFIRRDAVSGIKFEAHKWWLELNRRR